MSGRTAVLSIFTKLFRHSNGTRCLTRRYYSNTSTITQPGGKFTTDLSAYSTLSHGVTPLNSYGVIKVSGADSLSFLQGLLSNDIADETTTNTYNAILSPNGRYLYDCFVSRYNDDFLIETSSDSVSSFIKYLKKYKLRSKVKFKDMSDEYRVWSILTPPKLVQPTYNEIAQKYKDEQLCYIDPRYDALGIRILLNNNHIPHFLSNQYAPIGEDFYFALKCIYGIPSHGTHLISDKTIILESNLNYLNGVSFTKGCYVGQELIARTHFRGQIRKRLFGATIVDNGGDTKNHSLIKIDNKTDERDTIFPTWFNAQHIEDELENKNIVSTNDNNKVVGKVISMENAMNCCIAQLRNNAFIDVNTENPQTNGLQIQDTNYSIIPHFADYFNSFAELFAAKE